MNQGESKRAIEDSIRRLAQEYETIINNTQDATFLVDVDKNNKFKYKRINFAYLQLTGLHFADIKDKSPIEVFGPRLGQEIEDRYQDCINKKEVISYEEKLEKPKKIIFNTKLTPIVIDDQVEQIVGSSRDITDYKKMEKELKKNEKEYRSLFEESPIGLFKVDSNGNVIDVNKEMLKLLGSTDKESTLKLNIFKLPGLRNTKFTEQFDTILKSGKVISDEIYYISYWGKEAWINYNVKPILNENDQMIEAIIACQDVTEKKESEEKVKYLTFHDSLTGLYNRAYFKEELKRYDTERQMPLSIIMGDVNGLKLTNDAFGHKKGDELLIKIADLIKDCCRHEDLVARWGGDEFVILLPKTDEETAKIVSKRIKKACSKTDFDPVTLSIAVGYATKNSVKEDIFKIFKKAEDWMYKNKLNESRNAHSSIISSLKKTLYETTFETAKHCQRLKVLALKLGKSMGLSEHKLNELTLLAELHDLGKVAISENIIQKQSPLTKDEKKKMRCHPEIGYQIANSSKYLSNIAEGILSHHEAWDGSGYPQGLAGENIPLISRIIAVVDAYDVMTHGRPNKKPVNKETAIEALRRQAGHKFDHEIVGAFIDNVLNK